MAQDAKISELTTVPSLDGSEVVALVKSGVTYKGTLTALLSFFVTQNLTLSGNVVLDTAKTLTVKAGTNQRAGNATLTGGTIAVANTTITANSVIVLTRKTSGGTIGDLTYTLNSGVGFTINSDSGTDISVVSYLIIEVA